MPFIDGSLFCHNLPSRPQPEMGGILVTGATGYIGGRLVPELLARGYRVRVMVRAGSEELRGRWPDAEVVVADALDAGSLRKALAGIHAAYYLIHSLLLGHDEFEATEIQAATNFRKAAEAEGVARLIYLGALRERLDDRPSGRDHHRLRQRLLRDYRAPGEERACLPRAAMGADPVPAHRRSRRHQVPRRRAGNA
jgi:uncharacterized protein YbjT (DUF2867 family)